MYGFSAKAEIILNSVSFDCLIAIITSIGVPKHSLGKMSSLSVRNVKI